MYDGVPITAPVCVTCGAAGLSFGRGARLRTRAASQIWDRPDVAGSGSNGLAVDGDGEVRLELHAVAAVLARHGAAAGEAQVVAAPVARPLCEGQEGRPVELAVRLDPPGAAEEAHAGGGG